MAVSVLIDMCFAVALGIVGKPSLCKFFLEPLQSFLRTIGIEPVLFQIAAMIVSSVQFMHILCDADRIALCFHNARSKHSLCVDHILFLQHNDRSTCFNRSQRSRNTGGTSTHNHDICGVLRSKRSNFAGFRLRGCEFFCRNTNSRGDFNGFFVYIFFFFCRGGNNNRPGGNNQERTDTLREQVEILESLLPAQVSGEELVQLIEQKIAELGATSKKEMGKVMGALNKATNGNFDKAAAAKEVGARLS